MGSLGPLEIALIILAILVLFGYKRLPDASRSIGRSLRIFKGEMKGMKDDDGGASVRAKDAATATPVRGQIVSSASGDLTADLEADAREAEARAAEARARELRARADQARSGSADGSR